MGDAIREAYEDLFHVNEKPTASDKVAIEGKFKSVHNATDRVAAEQARTFFTLLKLADLDGSASKKSTTQAIPEADEKSTGGSNKEKTYKEKSPDTDGGERHNYSGIAGLRYNIEIHLPPTKDVEVYNAIFKSLKEHLLED
jgi:hypothetical protein